jgi:hypothetical protein
MQRMKLGKIHTNQQFMLLQITAKILYCLLIHFQVPRLIINGAILLIPTCHHGMHRKSR